MKSNSKRPITILIADDDPEDRMLAAEALKESRLANDIRFVEDGEELIDYLTQRGRFNNPDDAPRPGVILLDLNMPRKDGREALRTVLSAKLTNQDPQSLTLQIPLWLGALPLTLQGVHVQARIDDRGLLSGQLHGAISKTDVDTKILPTMATLSTLAINRDPNGSIAKTIIQLFEDQNNPVSQKKCQDNMADCCRTNPKTCKITPDEVRANQLIKIILVPDLQCYDAQGSWKPTPNGVDKDCLSVGLSFLHLCYLWLLLVEVAEELQRGCLLDLLV